MKNGNTIIGLFQGMFDKNIVTFNPGWDQDANELEEYNDVRKLNKKIKEKNIETDQESLEGDQVAIQLTKN